MLDLSKGIIYMAQGTFWFSAAGLLVKTAGKGLPPMEIVFGRAFIGLLLCLHFIHKSGIANLGNRKPLLIVRGVSGFIALGCIFHSIVHLPLADAVVIFHTNPLFAALLSYFILKERLGATELLCIAGGLCGVLLVAKPPFLFGGEAHGAGVDYLIAACSSLFAGLTYVNVRQLGKTEHPMVIVLYLYIVALPASFVLGVWEWRAPTWLDLGCIIGIGVFTQLGQVYLTKGLKLEEAGKATAVGSLGIVLAALWGMLFFDELMDSLALLGASIIIVCTAALGFSKKKNGSE